MGYTVLHIEKRKAVQLPLGQHIERGVQSVVETSVQTQEDGSAPDVQEDVIRKPFFPDNADPERTKLNREMIERPQFCHPRTKKMMVCSIEQTIRKRIKDAGISDIRDNQNIALEVILSGSNEIMNAMSPELLDEWVKDSVSWAQETWGKENVVSATLHMDETTPHIHMFVVPIVHGPSQDSIRKRRKALEDKKKFLSRKEYAQKLAEIEKYEKEDGIVRLCTGDVYNRKNLYKYHTSYAKDVGIKYGLERGIEAEPGCRVSHTTSIEYNRQLKRESMELEGIQNRLRNEVNQMIGRKDDVETELDKLTEQLEPLQMQITAVRQQLETVKKSKAQLERKRDDLFGENQQLENEKRTLKSIISGFDDSINSLQGKLRSYEAMVQGLLNEDVILMLPKICSKVLGQIVGKYFNGEFRGYTKLGNGCYKFVLKHQNGINHDYDVDSDGYVSHYGNPVIRKDGTQLQMPEFVDFFKVVPRQFVYEELEAHIRKKISAKSAERKKGHQLRMKP